MYDKKQHRPGGKKVKIVLQVLTLLASRCGKLKIYATDSKVITEITIQRVTANKPIKKISWNPQKKYNLKEVERKKRGIKNKIKSEQ